MNERSNEKALAILGQQFTSFINLQDNWDFFRGLAEYIKTIQDLAQTKPIIGALEKQRQLARQVYEQMNTEAMKELTKSANKLVPIAQNLLKNYEPLIKQTNEIAQKFAPIAKAVKEVQDRMAGLIHSSDPLYGFESDLFDVARFVRASGNEEAVKVFENNKKRNHNIYGNYTFSPVYEKIDDEKRKLERKEEVEAWGAWENLPLVKDLVYEPEETKNNFKKEADAEKALYWTWINFAGVYVEMEKIRKGEKTDRDAILFRMKDYRSFAQRVHNFITTELLKADTEQDKLEFDATKSILAFAGETITISKRAENDAHDLLKTLFKSRAKIWNSDEVLDDWKVDYNSSHIPKNKVYQAGKAVNRIVATETKIKDFLDVSTKTVSINKKYLKG